MENFEEILNDFENFKNLDYTQKLALIDKYKIEQLFTFISYENRSLGGHISCSVEMYDDIMNNSTNNSENRVYTFKPVNEVEQYSLLVWLLNKDRFKFKPFEVIKNEFLTEYQKANSKEQIITDYFNHFNSRINDNSLLSYNNIDNKDFRLFYNSGVKDYNYGNTNYEGLIKLLFESGVGGIYSLNISKLIDYCNHYFMGKAEANFFHYLQNEKENLIKIIKPPAKQKRKSPQKQIVTFEQLFKDDKHVEKVIDLLKGEGYLSSTGDWIEEPKLSSMVALYSYLLGNGYLKNTFSAPKISNAFNLKFGTNFSPKRFQPNEQKKADSHKEKFNIIPKITTS